MAHLAPEIPSLIQLVTRYKRPAATGAGRAATAAEEMKTAARIKISAACKSHGFGNKDKGW